MTETSIAKSGADHPSLEASVVATAPVRITWADYRRVAVMLGAFSLLLSYVAQLPNRPAPRAELVLGPLFALVVVVFVVWLLMVVIRNLATVRGLASPQYYLTFGAQTPADWIERPARTFNNLMQMPTLFFAVCTLMLVTHTVDRAQLTYAWLFVALRAVHAALYIGWNPLPYRFATWTMSSITLFVLWTRFAWQAWPGF